jgi:hypothetical protein
MNLSTKFPAQTLFLIIAFSVVTFFTYPTHGQDWSAAQKEVWKMQEAVWSLWKKGDGEGRMALYHKDCTLWFYRASFPSDKRDISERTRNRPNIESFELEPQEVKVFGNIAIVLYSLKYTALGRDFNQRVMTTWMKQNGKWQIIGSMRANQPSQFG